MKRIWSLAILGACGGGTQRPGASTAPPRATTDRAEVNAEPVHGDDRVSTCRKRDDGSYDLTADELLLRHGLGARTFGDVPSSSKRPIEVCGILGEVKWLTNVTCADGSRPWGKDLDKAHGARSGSQMGGGRCGEIGGIIDLYVAPCPEKSYAIYIDMYECGPGEDLWRGVKRPGG